MEHLATTHVPARLYAMAATMLALLNAPPMLAQWRNIQLMHRADVLFESTTSHGTPPSAGARMAAAERLMGILKDAYSPSVADTLGTLPQAQVRSGVLTLWLVPLVTFLLVAYTRRLRTWEMRHTLTAWGLSVVTTNLAATIFSVHALHEDVPAAAEACSRLVLAQVGAGVSFVALWNLVGHIAVKGLRWAAACTCTYWAMNAARGFLAASDHPLARHFPLGAERWFLGHARADIARGFVVYAGWTLVLVAIGRAWTMPAGLSGSCARQQSTWRNEQ